MYTDGWEGHDGLIIKDNDHTNKFILHIKECEFRFSNKSENLMKIMNKNILKI